MDIMLAYCGLDCSTCPLHLATLETDKSRQWEMRADIARLCTEHYKMDVQPEDINDCDGCRAATGNLFTGCAQCRIRKCATGRHLESCAYCGDYACEILKAHWQLDPGAQVRLEEIRNAAGKITPHQA
jgi:hypothetical protein